MSASADVRTDRLTAVTADAGAALHAVLERHRVTEDFDRALRPAPQR
jgi:hypothetical protein